MKKRCSKLDSDLRLHAPLGSSSSRDSDPRVGTLILESLGVWTSKGPIQGEASCKCFKTQLRDPIYRKRLFGFSMEFRCLSDVAIRPTPRSPTWEQLS